MTTARQGGAGAADAARQAALIAAPRDRHAAAQALRLAADLDPLDSEARLGLVELLAGAGDLDRAASEARAVLEAGIDETARARAALALGEIARLSGDADAARAAFAQMLAIENALLQAQPQDADAARWFAKAKGRIAELDADSGDYVSARAGDEAGLAMLKALAVRSGETPDLAHDIADAELRLADLDLRAADAQGARARLGEAVGRYEALCVTRPVPALWRSLARAWTLAADAAWGAADPKAAGAALDKALALRLKLAARDSREAWALAALWRIRARFLAASGDLSAAREASGFAKAICARALREEPGADAARHRFHAGALLDDADLALQAGDHASAAATARGARSLAGDDAEIEAQSWAIEGAARLAQEGPAAALDAYERAVAAKVRAGDKGHGLADALCRAGDAALAAHAADRAHGVFSELFLLRLALAEAEPGAHAPLRDLASALEKLGLAALAREDRDGAASAWESEFNLLDQAYEDSNDPDALRALAHVEARLASLHGLDASARRASALARLDRLAERALLSADDARLRARLWRG